MAAEDGGVTVFITLGSNIEPRANLRRALTLLAGTARVEAVSGVYESEAWGAPGTPRFLNAAVRARTRLGARHLRRQLRRIEAALGRQRSGDRNAPRPIDLDIALYGSERIDDPQSGLRIPDPEIAQRGYLALPLAEIGPDVRLPDAGSTLAEIAARLAGRPDAPRRVALELAAPPAEAG